MVSPTLYEVSIGSKHSKIPFLDVILQKLIKTCADFHVVVELLFSPKNDDGIFVFIGWMAESALDVTILVVVSPPFPVWKVELTDTIENLIPYASKDVKFLKFKHKKYVSDAC